MSQLKAVLAQAGHPVVELAGSGGTISVLPWGARVIELSPGGENVFWVNPKLLELETAKELLTTDKWPNTGGDRTWIGSEVELFIADLDRPWDTYRAPASVDPGHYEVRQAPDHIAMRNRTRVHLFRSNVDCDVELTRTVRMAPNPLRLEVAARPLVDQTEYAGYELTARLDMLSGADSGIRLDLWGLLQLPPVGEVVVPVRRRTEPRHYFGHRGKPFLRSTDIAVHFVVDANGRHKIGVRAADVTGRMGYLRQLDEGRHALIVRNIVVNPSGTYIDVPWDDRDDEGYCVQCFNDAGDGRTFGEMEYHAPAVGHGTGRTSMEDVSQVWAYVGASDTVLEIAEWLLGPCL